MNKEQFFEVVRIFLILLFVSITSYSLAYCMQKSYYDRRIIELEMQIPRATFEGIDGVAYGGRYFCIYARGKSYSEVMEACAHEYMHTSGQMIDADRSGS